MRGVATLVAVAAGSLGFAALTHARPDVDRRAPRLVSAVVQGNTARLTFSEALARRPIALGKVQATADGRPLRPRAAVAGRRVTLVLGDRAWGDELVRIRLSRRAVRDRAGNWFRGATVVPTNRSPAGCAPVLTGLGDFSLSTNTSSDLHVRSTGTVRAVMVFIDFPDAGGSEQTADLTAQLGHRAAAYLAHVSGGRMTLELESRPEWVRMPRRSDEYGVVPGSSGAAYRALLEDAFAAADRFVDFRPYDIVYFVNSAGSAPSSSPAWTTRRGGGFRVDGVEKRYVTAIQAHSDEVPRPLILIHETLHFFGLPDLYLYQRVTWDSAMYTGAWDVMSIPTPGVAELMAWQRWKLGWLAPEQIRCARRGWPIEVELAPLGAPGGVKTVVVRESPRSAYVLENRQRVGEDWGICRPGVLVYRVDGMIPNGGGPLRLLRAEPDTDLAEVARCRSNYAAAFSLEGVAGLDDSSLPFRLELVETAPGGAIRVRVTPR